MVEEVVGLLGLLPALLVAEDEVDPVVNVPRDVLRLEGLPQGLDEVLRVLGPRREPHVPDLRAAVPITKVNPVPVEEEVTLGNKTL